MCHRLNLQHARHNGLFGEVSLEERLVGCHVLDADNGIGTQSDDFVYQLHGIAMREQLADTVDIHDWLFVGIVDRSLNLMFTYLFAHLTSELVIDGVTRTRSDDASLDGFANQRHVTDDVKQLMACTLILPYQRLVLDIT